MPHNIQISLEFHDYGNAEFNDFAEGVQTGIEDHPLIFDPTKATVSNLVLLALITTMLGDYTKYKKGGSEQKQIYLTSKGYVMDAINKLVPWINSVANGDSKIIILAGFKAAYATPAQKPGEEAAPQEIVVKNSQTSGILTAECESLGNNHFYGCIVSEGKPLDQSLTIGAAGQIKFPAGSTNVIYHDLNHERLKKFMDLTPGIKYWFYFYVVSTAGVTSLSQAVVKMCI